ncbi:MAG: xylulokinase [Bacilli bacterium]
MKLYLGADLGTSAIKITLADEKGNVLSSLEETYPLNFPKPGYSQQNPEDWYNAFIRGIKKILSGYSPQDVRSIAIDGQMHGLVALDKENNVVYPAILWNDSRSFKESDEINETIGIQQLIEETGNISYPGFTASKILWLQKNEPLIFASITHIMLPKDYLVFRLTGKYSTDYSDACGTLLLNTKEHLWSKKMLDFCQIKENMLPTLHYSAEKIANIRTEIAEDLGLSPSCFVLAGSGDNAGAAISLGVIKQGQCSISLGTSGTIFIPSDSFHCDSQGAIHAFNCYNEKYCLLACALTSASSLKWLNENIFMTSDFTSEQNKITDFDLGKNTVFFLPYLMGERSPINDPFARAVFFGLDMSSSRKEMTQAVMEGVCFSLKDSLNRINSMSVFPSSARVTGGGSKSKLWLKMLANILNLKLEILENENGPSYGMILLSLVEDGIYSSLEEAVSTNLKIKETIFPNPDLVSLYQNKYEIFSEIYPAVARINNKNVK